MERQGACGPPGRSSLIQGLGPDFLKIRVCIFRARDRPLPPVGVPTSAWARAAGYGLPEGGVVLAMACRGHSTGHIGHSSLCIVSLHQWVRVYDRRIR